jgi:GNAT superfamily N-acetyltransferase
VKADNTNPFNSSVIKEPVYHGTSSKFGEFKTGVDTSRAVLFSEFKVKSQGIFFSQSAKDAKSYGSSVVKCWVNLTNPLFNPNAEKAGQPGRETYQRFSKEKEQDFIKIFSPLAHEADIDGEKVPVIDKMIGQIEVRDVRFSSRSEETYPEWIYELLGDGGIIWDVMDDEGVIKRMKALGYDGTFVNEPNDYSGSSVFVVSPDQIKIIDWGDYGSEEMEESTILESQEFKYGLPLRPAGVGSVPTGYTRYDEMGSYDDSGERDRSTRHGVVIYPNELSDEEIKRFELVPIHNEAYLQRWIDKAWAKLGKYAHKYLEMGGEEALSEQMRSMAERFGPIHPKEYERAEKEIIAKAKGEKIEEGSQNVSKIKYVKPNKEEVILANKHYEDQIGPMDDEAPKIVARVNGKFAGAIWARSFMHPKAGELTEFDVVVLPDFQRQGIAKGLVNKIKGKHKKLVATALTKAGYSLLHSLGMQQMDEPYGYYAFESVEIEEVTAYHGTNRVFQKFDKSSETRNAKEYGPGHYFSMSADDASNYAGDDEGANVHVVDIDDEHHKFWRVSNHDDFVKIAKRLGLKHEENTDKKRNWFYELVRLIGEQFFKEAMKAGSSSAFLADKLKKMGYSGVIVPKEYNGSGKADWYVVYDDKAVRHKFIKESVMTETVQSDREIRWLADILMDSLIRNVKRNKQFNGAATNTGQFKDSRDWIELEDFMNEWNVTVVFATAEKDIGGSWASSQKTIYLSEPPKDDGLRASLHEFVRTKLSDTLERQIKTRYMDVLVHELTHAFDDFRSKGKFKKDSYKSPTSGGGDSEYWLQQIEINARFAETAQALVSKKLSLDSGTQKGFQNYMEVFQSAIRKWEIMPEWVQRRLRGRMYKEYSELSNQEKDIILVKEGWSPLASALDNLAKGKTKELPDEIAWTSADYRFKDDKAYTTNQIHTFSQILKKAINNPDEYKKNMRWVNYVIEGIQSAISKNPEVVGYIQDYFKLSDDEMESIKNSTAWLESKNSFIKNFIQENTDEDGFKIVDYSETLYHGSTTPVSQFSLSGNGRMGKGLYLTTDKDWAEFYAKGGRQGKSGQKLSDKQGHIYQFNVEGKAAVVTDEQEFLDYIRSNYEPMEDEFSKYGDWSNAVVAHVSGWAKEEGIDIIVSPGEGLLTQFPQVLVVSEGAAKPKKKMEESFFKNFINNYYEEEWIPDVLEEAKELIKKLPSENPDDFTVEKITYDHGGHSWAIHYQGNLVGHVSSGYKRTDAAKEFVDSWKRKIQFKEREKQQKNLVNEKKLKLQKEYDDNKSVVDNAHKIKNIDFTFMPLELFNQADPKSGDAILVHKSPVYNNRQSSEYKLMLIDGELVYARKANHWGRFHTNIKVGDEDADPSWLPDQFGRVGYRDYFWHLDGGDDSKKTSQAGYVPVKNLKPDLKESFFKDFIHQHYDKKWGEEPEDFGFSIEESVSRVPLVLELMAAEARKAGSFENYEKDFSNEIKRGLYYHWTDNPDFKVSPQKGPMDASSLGSGKVTAGALMCTTDLEAWSDYGKDGKGRDYVAVLDLSDVPRNGYRQSSRGFGNEFFLQPENAKLIKVVKVLPRSKALSFERSQNKHLPQSKEELKDFYNKATQDSQTQGQMTEDTGTLTLWHGGKAGIDKLSADFTKSKIFGNAIYFTNSYQSAKKYATERYGADGVVYKAKVRLNTVAQSPVQFKNDESYDSLVFKLASGETNYAVKNDEQVLSLEKVESSEFQESENKIYKWHDDIIQANPFEINPDNEDERSGSLTDLVLSGKSPAEWAKSVDLSEPIEVTMFRDGEVKVRDGHHRQLAAQILNKKLPTKIHLTNVKPEDLGARLEKLQSTPNGDQDKIRREIERARENPDSMAAFTHMLTFKESEREKSYIAWEKVIEPTFDDEGDEDGELEYVLIDKIWIDPADRGKGKARELLRNAIKEIKQKHPDLEIKLSASGELDKTTDLKKLVDFYEREGFSVDDQDSHSSVMMTYGESEEEKEIQ